MARGRMVNRKISNDKRVNDLPLQAQLLFTWLIPHLDCNGCFYGSAQMIKSLVIPRKNWSKKQIERWLTLVEKSKISQKNGEILKSNAHSVSTNFKNNQKNPLIIRYTVDGDQYLFMPGFASEQVGLRYDKEKPVFPTFDGKNTERIRKESDKLRTEGEGEGEVEVKDKEYTLSVFNHWNQQNIIVHKKLTDDIRSMIVRTLRSYSAEEIKAAISNYSEIVHGEQYFFKYKWTLKDFLKRGIEKFADLEIAKSNFKKEQSGKDKDRRLPQAYTESPNDEL